MKEISLETHSRVEMIDITAAVQKAAGEEKIESGICLIYTPHTTAAPDMELSYLCFNTLVIEPPDKSFADSYERVASTRIARWKSGDTTVGE